jgi:rubrerythrin
MGIEAAGRTQQSHWRGLVIEEHALDEADGNYVAFLETGASAKGSFRCSDCGYGVVVTGALPPCPMCGGGVWEEAPWSPLGRSSPP